MMHRVAVSAAMLVKQPGGGAAPLAKLSLANVLRSLVILSASSSRRLLKPSLAVLATLAQPPSPWLDVGRNRLLNWLVKHTLYAQFSAGENKREVQASIRQIKQLGYRGVLLGYARETTEAGAGDAAGDAELDAWLQGTLQTVDMAEDGDFVALKCVSPCLSVLDASRCLCASVPLSTDLRN